MSINDFINSLDFNENDYLYHVTGNGKAESILEEGLLVNGTNIIGTDNILFTTCAVLYPEDVLSEEKFKKELLDSELGDSLFRDNNEMVIIGVPKSLDMDIVDDYLDYIDGEFYEGVIDKSYIMGYFNKDHEFIPNPNYQYGNDDFYEENNFSK